MSPAPPLLAFENAGKTFRTPAGELTVLRDVTLDVQPGDFVALTGPSGSGKSTLLNLAALLDGPTAGRVLVRGEDTAGWNERRRCRHRAESVGMVFQTFHLLPNRTALDNVRFRFRYTRTPAARARRLAQDALAGAGLAERATHPARLLSGGEMQRVALARAIAQPPDLLLADEPTGNLDAAAARLVRERLTALHRAGLTIVLATHNLEWLDCATRRWVCAEGTVHAV